MPSWKSPGSIATRSFLKSKNKSCTLVSKRRNHDRLGLQVGLPPRGVESDDLLPLSCAFAIHCKIRAQPVWVNRIRRGNPKRSRAKLTHVKRVAVQFLPSVLGRYQVVLASTFGVGNLFEAAGPDELVRHTPRRFVLPLLQRTRSPSGVFIRVARIAGIRHLQPIGFRGRDEPERVAPHIHVGDGLLDPGHMAVDALASGGSGLMVRVLRNGRCMRAVG